MEREGAIETSPPFPPYLDSLEAVSCREWNCGQMYGNNQNKICKLSQKCYFPACANFWKYINLLTRICGWNAGTVALKVLGMTSRSVNLLEKRNWLIKQFFNFANIKFKFLIGKCHNNIVISYQEIFFFQFSVPHFHQICCV